MEAKLKHGCGWLSALLEGLRPGQGRASQCWEWGPEPERAEASPGPSQLVIPVLAAWGKEQGQTCLVPACRHATRVCVPCYPCVCVRVFTSVCVLLMCMCTRVCVCTCITCVYMCECVHLYTQVCVLHVCICVSVHVFTWVYVCIALVCACVHARVCVLASLSPCPAHA